MKSPLLKLTSLAIRHLDEEPDDLVRADMLDAAANILSISGKPDRAEQLSTTAAIIREAANAQLQLKSLFS